jgi:nucleoside-diphosphate-sugar epimerase
VSDIVSGTLLAGELLTDGAAVNIGTTERTSVNEAAHLVCRLMNHNPGFRYLLDKPTGPLNRVADNTLAKDLLGWEPKVDLVAGVTATIDWYTRHRTPDSVRLALSLDN